MYINGIHVLYVNCIHVHVYCTCPSLCTHGPYMSSMGKGSWEVHEEEREGKKAEEKTHSKDSKDEDTDSTEGLREDIHTYTQ